MDLNELQEKLKGLSPDEQQEKAQELMKELPEEELNKLQQQQCPFCLMAENKIDAEVIYEDDSLKAVLDIYPANKGHIVIFPKKHYSVLPQMHEEEIAHLFKIANRLSNAVHDALNAEGTNLYVANGVAAGQKSPHVIVHVIPRFKDDGIDFTWKPKDVKKDELVKLASEIRNFIPREEEKEVKEEEIEELGEVEEERIP